MRNAGEVLRTTRFGNGFVKEDVLAFIDELNIRIYQLEQECEQLKQENAALKQRLKDAGSGVD